MKVPRDKDDPPGKGSYWTLAPGFMDASPETCIKLNKRRRKKSLQKKVSEGSVSKEEGRGDRKSSSSSSSSESLRSVLLTPPSSPNDMVFSDDSQSLTSSQTSALMRISHEASFHVKVKVEQPSPDELSERCRQFSISNLLL